MARRRAPIVSSWRRPKTSIYSDNYSFGFNFYDDMMKWINRREQGVRDPIPRLPTVPETAFRKFQRPKTPDVKKFEDDMLQSAVKRTHDRIEGLVWRKERDPRRRARSAEREFGSQESLSTLTGNLSLRDRRSRLEQQQHEIESRMASAGLRFSSDLEAASSSREETTITTIGGTSSRRERISHLSSADVAGDTTIADMRCKQLEVKISQLENRLEEAENRVRTEVMRVKRAYEDQISELEIRLESAHRQNIELQKTIQRQAMQCDH